MKVSEFNYELPKELIAQVPIKNRDESRLMVLNKKNQTIEHKTFKDILDYLEPGDCLVRNNTKVIPARLYGIKEETGAHVEFLLLKRIEGDIWEVMVKPGRKLMPGATVIFDLKEEEKKVCYNEEKLQSNEISNLDNIELNEKECNSNDLAENLNAEIRQTSIDIVGKKKYLLKAEILEKLEDGNRIVKFEYDGIFNEILNEIGLMPLPPYIHEKLEEKDRYQTVYAKYEGSAAAPTAGLHFTEELLEEARKKGVEIANVTLHVGIGTFRPVKVENIEEHDMHTEHFYIKTEDAEKINKAKREGHRIIAVGTTSCRVIESIADENGMVKETEGDTNIFIYPGYKFKCLDNLITNFHLPESTLIMLVSALAGKDFVMKAYEEAVKEKYRFFSFGDAMLVLTEN